MCAVDNGFNDIEVQNSEKTTYQFDSASITTTGYVEINEHFIHMHFPDNSAVIENTNSNYKNVNIFLNEQLCLDFNSLPFFSFYDRIRIMDMFVKAYELFSNTVQGYYFKPFPHSNKSNYSYSSIVTKTIIKNVLTLYCFEDYVTTSIHLTLENCEPESEPDRNELLAHFRISVGQNIVFDTARDLKGLKPIYQNFVIQFLLHKIVHID